MKRPVRKRPRVLLFAYGTLLDDRVQWRVFGREVAVTPAELRGFSVKKNLVRGRYPGIVSTKGANAAGGVLRITSGELRRADAYEDAPQLYRRKRVIVKAGTRRVRCWVYVPVVCCQRSETWITRRDALVQPGRGRPGPIGP